MREAWILDALRTLPLTARDTLLASTDSTVHSPLSTVHRVQLTVTTYAYMTGPFQKCDIHLLSKLGELRNGAKTKAGPLEAEQL